MAYPKELTARVLFCMLTPETIMYLFKSCASGKDGGTITACLAIEELAARGMLDQIDASKVNPLIIDEYNALKERGCHNNVFPTVKDILYDMVRKASEAASRAGEMSEIGTFTFDEMCKTLFEIGVAASPFVRMAKEYGINPFENSASE